MNPKYADYLMAKTRQDYNLIAGDFSRTRNRVWEELEFLGKYVCDNEKILDVGCGNGRLYELFKERTIDYYGVDFSEELVGIAGKRYPQFKFQVADALNLPFPDNFFDKVFGVAIFHHIPSKELRMRFLKEMKRVLKPEGRLIMTVWKFHETRDLLLIFKSTILKLLGLSKLDFGDILEPWGKKIKRYYHCFSRRELRGAMTGAGFKIKELGVLKNKRGNRQNVCVIAKKT
ncbi:MAG: methyltransferase domain-containing protein [bacterium]|nr:methyltransferase domain-containing protein [bacterium]